MIDLKEIFSNLLINYTTNSSLINELWDEVEKNYSEKKDIIIHCNIWKIY